MSSNFHTVLMGDPTHFSVVGGANPHTRDRWGRRKRVDRALAIQQWGELRRTLVGLELHVLVVSPDPALPGLVYPANAGFRHGDVFVLSNLTPTRANEQAHYRRVIEAAGLPCRTITSRFEGEADLFPTRGGFVFTHGEIRRQRFAPRWSCPPWRRIYGFRSEPRALDEIEAIQPLAGDVLRIRLVDERFYHGDTCLCTFGQERKFLLAYLPAIDSRDAKRLRKEFGDRMVELDHADAAIYAANSFALCRNGRSYLVVPRGISPDLEHAIRDRGTEPIEVDVSEFYKKGGGSVKCMIGDLGVVRGDELREMSEA